MLSLVLFLFLYIFSYIFFLLVRFLMPCLCSYWSCVILLSPSFPSLPSASLVLSVYILFLRIAGLCIWYCDSSFSCFRSVFYFRLFIQRLVQWRSVFVFTIIFCLLHPLHLLSSLLSTSPSSSSLLFSSFSYLFMWSFFDYRSDVSCYLVFCLWCGSCFFCEWCPSCCLLTRRPPTSMIVPYTPMFRST